MLATVVFYDENSGLRPHACRCNSSLGPRSSRTFRAHTLSASPLLFQSSVFADHDVSHLPYHELLLRHVCRCVVIDYNHCGCGYLEELSSKVN